MNFIEELEWRGMLFDMTPGAKEAIEAGSCKGYIGFDPTAPSMTIGNYVQIMLLTLWQKSGNTPYVLMGGATGRVGDPSGKDQERQLKSYDELDKNLSFQTEQMKQYLAFDGTNSAELVNNLDFYEDMNVLQFLRDVGKTLTVRYMMSKDSVKKRLETGLSFTEFSYQLLQAYDFQMLYEREGCTFQMGGSDQWGNITSGTEFIRRNVPDGKAFAITTPLLTKSDGKKFGKSESGNIWLDPKMTSPYDFYQFWIRSDDADLEKFVKYFSLKSREEMQSMIDRIETEGNQVKKELAQELTARIHGVDSLNRAEIVSTILYAKNATYDMLASLLPDDFLIISNTIKGCTLTSPIERTILDILTSLKIGTGEDNIVQSKSEAKRLISSNSIKFNRITISDESEVITDSNYFYNLYGLLEVGKKRKYLIIKQGS